MSLSPSTSLSMTASPAFPQGESNPHASIREAKLAPYAAGVVRPASGPSVTLTETDPVIVVRSASGGWIVVPMSPEQKVKLAGLHEKLKKNPTDDIQFNLHKVYSETNGIRDFNYSTDNQTIKDLRALVAEIVQRKDMPWEEYPTNFRAPLNVSSNMTRNAPCAKTLEERLETFKSGLEETESSKVVLAEKVFSECETILKGLPETIKDLEPKDKKDREEAIQNALTGFENMHKEAVFFTVGTKSDVSWDSRWEMATANGFLQIDPEKDHQYLEDVVRLKCKDRETYMRESTEIEEKHKYFAPLPKPTGMQRFKAFFSGEKFPERSETASVLESRRERAETFFVQLTEALHSNDKGAVETLLNGPLFEMAFEELHDEERKVVRQKMIEKYTQKAPDAPVVVAPSDPSAAQAAAAVDAADKADEAKAIAEAKVAPEDEFQEVDDSSEAEKVTAASLA